MRNPNHPNGLFHCTQKMDTSLHINDYSDGNDICKGVKEQAVIPSRPIIGLKIMITMIGMMLLIRGFLEEDFVEISFMLYSISSNSSTTSFICFPSTFILARV